MTGTRDFRMNVCRYRTVARGLLLAGLLGSAPMAAVQGSGAGAAGGTAAGTGAAPAVEGSVLGAAGSAGGSSADRSTTAVAPRGTGSGLNVGATAAGSTGKRASGAAVSPNATGQKAPVPGTSTGGGAAQNAAASGVPGTGRNGARSGAASSARASANNATSSSNHATGSSDRASRAGARPDIVGSGHGSSASRSKPDNAARSAADNAGGEDAAPTPAAKVQVTAAAMRTLKETVVAYGHLQPDPDGLVNVSLSRAGRIEQLWVSPGQRVRAGDRLLALRTAPGAAVDFDKAQAAVRYAEQDLASVRAMFKDHLATREQVAKAEQTLRDARSSLQAQQRVGSGQSSEIVKAPFDGIVTALSVGRGQRVQADATALTMAKLDALIVTLGVEPEEALRLRPGAPVELTPVFPPTTHIDSKVDRVHGMVNPQTRLIDTVVRFPHKPDQNLILDEDLRGIITLREQHTLAVPRSAVLRDDRGSYLFVVRDDKAQRVQVDTGLQDEDWIGVSGALQAGDPVVNLGNYELSDGMPVRQSSGQ